jgi:hypothetical protein
MFLLFVSPSAKGEAAPAAAKMIHAKEVVAYQAAFGGSQAAAEERLGVQARGRMIVDRLERALGPAYAGVWFDPSKGQFMVPLLPRSDRSAAVAQLSALGLVSDYQVVPAQFSWAALEAEQRDVDAEVAGLIQEHALEPASVRTALDPVTNQVQVEIARGLSDDEHALLEDLERGREAVGLKESEKQSLRTDLLSCAERFCGKPLRGGVEIYSNSASCTAGFRALGNNGKRYLLTAGHCIQATSQNTPRWQWFTVNSDTGDTWQGVGIAEQWQSLGLGDWAILNATGTPWDTPSWPAAVVWWGGHAEPKKALNELQPMAAEASSYLGETVCHSGATTGTTCGSVTALNVTIQSEEGTNTGETEVKGRELCAGPGDSGGPVFSGSSALGLVTAGTGFFCYSSLFGEIEMFYAELKKATAALEVKVAPITRLSSQTTLSVTKKECGAEPVRASGKVMHSEVPVEADLVNINFFHRENGQWILRSTVPTNVDNGSFQIGDVILASGEWRARASFPGSEMFSASESADQGFTILRDSLSIGGEAGDSPGPRTVAQCNGTIDAFYRTSEGNLGHNWFDAAGGGWLAGDLPATVAPSSVPRAVVQSNGTIDVFYRTTEGNLGHNWFAPNGGGWKSGDLPASMASDPHVVVQFNGTIDVFYRTTGGNLGHNWFDVAGGGWLSGELPASMASDPNAVVQPNGRTVDVFYRTKEGKLGHNWFDTAGGGWLSGDLPAKIAPGSVPVPVVQANGTIDVFYRTTEGKLGHNWFAPNNGGWSSGDLPASMASDPSAVVQPNGTIDVFYRTTAGKLGHNWFDIAGGGWLSGELPASMTSDPHVIAQPNGTIDVFYRTTEGKLGHNWFAPNNGGWSSGDLPASMASDPHVAVRNNGTVDVFYRTPAGKLGHNWFDVAGGGWLSGDLPASISPRPPAVTTAAASGISTSAATVSGTIDPENSATTYYFQYGKTTAYGSKVPISAEGVGSGGDPVAVSKTLSGLAEGTVYHYRLVATSPEGTSQGMDQTFTTGGNATIPTQLAAMPVTEPFDGSAESQARFASNWSKLGWAVGKGQNTTSGWGPSTVFASGSDGIYYATSRTDTGSGLATVVTMAVDPGQGASNPGRYFSLWLDMSTPGTTRNGYELRFTNAGAGTYNAVLFRWQGGAQSELVSKAAVSIANGNAFALVDKGSTVSAWVNSGTGFSQLLSAVDSAFSSGNSGLEGGGNLTRLNSFKTGGL